MLEYPFPGLCAEDDSVILQRSSRFVHHQQLEALPPPSKFSQASNLPTGLVPSRSADYSSKWTKHSRHELRCDAAQTAQRPSSDPSNWTATSLRASLMEDASQLLRSPSLAVIWESLMTKSDQGEHAPGHTATVAHPPTDALADATRPPRERPPAPP
jgi:hypothetical protein